MRRTLPAFLAVALVCLSLSLTSPPSPALSATLATTSGPASSSPTISAGSDLAVAQDALAVAVRALSAGDATSARSATTSGRPDATLALRDLFLARADLAGRDRAQADALLARPSDGGGDRYGDGYRVPSKQRCDRNLCLHWVPRTEDAPPSAKWINTTFRALKQVWRTEVGKLGYRPPVADGTRGGDSRFDVYLKNLADQGVYGYCAPEKRVSGERWISTGYCVLDDDFARAEYGAPPIKSMKVTAAHEFFHAVQYAYDFGEDPWMLESSATWIEERYADAINDNRQYLHEGQVRLPGIPLDTFSPNRVTQYGNWVFWEYLSKRFGNSIVKRAWEAAGTYQGAGKKYSVAALRKVLASKGGFGSVFRSYAGTLPIAAQVYPEGKAWPSPQVARELTLSATEPRASTSTSVDHLSSRILVMRPDSSLTGEGRQALLTLNGPDRSTGAAAFLIVRMIEGQDVRKPIELTRTGYARVRFDFGADTVRSAVVSLINGSTRYRCRSGNSAYACSGKPRDDQQRFALTVTAVQ